MITTEINSIRQITPNIDEHLVKKLACISAAV